MCVCLRIIKHAGGAGCLTRCRAAADGVIGCGCVSAEGQPCGSNKVPVRPSTAIQEGGEAIPTVNVIQFTGVHAFGVSSLISSKIIY